MKQPDPSSLVDLFLQVAKLAGVDLAPCDLTVERLPAPHTPPSRLPDGKSAVYVFIFKGRALKIGKAGPNSNARYTSQHYNAGSAPSTLAATLLKRGDLIGENITMETAPSWIKENTDRINFLLDAKHGKFVLALLESFMQCKLRPMFEGFES